MNTLIRYLDVIVDPTFDEFHADSTSARLAFLTCVAIYHSVDRVAEAEGVKASHIRQVWNRESLDFAIVDVIAHHLKHVKSSDERIAPGKQHAISIGHVLGFNAEGDEMDLRTLYYVIRDAVRFVHRKAGTEPPKAA